jgi:hypothetical protein
MNTDSYKQNESPAATTPRTTGKPAVRTPSSVADILARWPLKKHTYTLAPALSKYFLSFFAVLLVMVITVTVLFISAGDVFFDFDFDFSRPSSQGGAGGGVINLDGDRPFADGASGEVLLPWADEYTIIPAESLKSSYAALADLSTGENIASRKADEVIYPASMTKVMTLIVVVENLPSEDSLQDTITVSQAVYDEMKRQGSSGIGMEAGEKLTVEAMLYALMLKSDGIAACELAKYIAGSEEAFVELMNQKAENMGLPNTHFMNPTGLFHEDHKTTSREIASIMAYAMNMNLCRKILKTQLIVDRGVQRLTYTVFVSFFGKSLGRHRVNYFVYALSNRKVSVFGDRRTFRKLKKLIKICFCVFRFVNTAFNSIAVK